MTANFGPPPGFGMIPAWLAWKQPSGNAVLVYLHLALFGTFNTGTLTYEECRPSVQTLADGGRLREKTGYPGTGLSVSTVERALRELKTLGAIVGEVRFDEVTRAQLPTVYRLIHNAPAPTPPFTREGQPRSTYPEPEHPSLSRCAHRPGRAGEDLAFGQRERGFFEEEQPRRRTGRAAR